MLKSVLASALVGFVAADCDGNPCSLLSVSVPGRPEEAEVEGEPSLTTNTFTAVDKCATSEVRDLTSWVLSYYEDVSNQLDVSFSNILTTARLANSALRYLGSLSSELQAFQRVQNISTEMNAMLRTCLADAMHLSASMERCDMSFSHDNFGVDTVTTSDTQGIDSVFVQPVDVSAKGTCLSALCEHIVAWNDTCGDRGFASDLERIAAAHDLEGTKYSFAASRESTYHQPPHHLYTQDDGAGTFAMLNEDLFTQEAALLHRVKLWLDVQFHGMMVMVRRALNGGQFAQASDLDVCGALGFPLDHVSWLSLAFEKCEGSMQRTWLKVSPMNRQYMESLVHALGDKIPNVYKAGKPGVLYGGLTTNLCKKFQDIEPEIKLEMEKLQSNHATMSEGSGDPKALNNFYLGKVAEIGPNGQAGQDFTSDTTTTQHYMNERFLQPPF